ncbi:nitrite reductase [Fulvivirga ligni]|uniref:nitrite reductase n=1 Tax=Fulvivirga ligni TaxID=2904246 RepID=UPI001F1ECC71|nr:nitrite reductase [Fulvivirga ligni]UII21121.1 nitrite reductase [Fulvivirga ligni]
MSVTLNENISQLAQKDIRELETKIEAFKTGQIDEERFKAFRLARGVYGQRQLGVQMFRIKLPYGKLTGEQLVRIADLSEQYTNGNLHATTRQNIQLHYVHLDDTPEMWAKLEETGVTTKEACGNTVRTVTASDIAGIDPNEPFDVSPYAEAVTQYFLRNPINQEMGRKIKMAFSSSEKDSAFTYIHDFGFIPKIENGQRGFKVVIGGGLGAQPFIAETAYEFLPEDKIIPFIEAGLRVFDRYGEREKRFKARMKFLIEEKRGLGVAKFMELVNDVQKSLANHSVPVELAEELQAAPAPKDLPEFAAADERLYQEWLDTNVFEQKQKGFYAIKIKLPLGNISSEKARKLVALTEGYVADDYRISISQGIILKFARPESLPYIYHVLSTLDLAQPGSDTIIDITACPGTDTCNLGVTNSTAISEILEDMIYKEFNHLVKDSDIHIKISGCMNSCGQHMIANIGFHGSSIKNGNLVIPALQTVIGGGVDASGKGFVADKVIKLPTKRIPDAMRTLLTDYEDNGKDTEYYNDYYIRQGKKYFYDLLKPFANLETITEDDYKDWGETETFVPEIGTGECAGVTYDMVGTIINDAKEKLALGKEAFEAGYFADSIYHSYSTQVIGAKALLLSKDVKCNTHIGIIKDFDTYFYENGEVKLNSTFEAQVLKINNNEPTKEFAKSYLAEADEFFQQVLDIRKQQIEAGNLDKEVLNPYRA